LIGILEDGGGEQIKEHYRGLVLLHILAAEDIVIFPLTNSVSSSNYAIMHNRVIKDTLFVSFIGWWYFSFRWEVSPP